MQEHSRCRPLGGKYQVELWLPLAASLPAEKKVAATFGRAGAEQAPNNAQLSTPAISGDIEEKISQSLSTFDGLARTPVPDWNPLEPKFFDATGTPWIEHRRVKGTIYPATGIIVMANQGAKQLADPNPTINGEMSCQICCYVFFSDSYQRSGKDQSPTTRAPCSEHFQE